MTSDRDRHRPEPTASSALDQSNTTRPSKEERRRRYKEVVERMRKRFPDNPELAKHTKVRIFLRDADPFRMHEDLRRSQFGPGGGPKLGERYPPRKPLEYWPRRCEPMGEEIGC